MKQGILVIDDEPNMLGLLRRILTEHGDYRVVAESNPLEVPVMLENSEYDLIIADLKMPGMDGMDILRLVRDHNRSEVVIIITAFESVESISEAMSFGAFDYIVKPFKKDRLLRSVENAMRSRQMVRETGKLQQATDTEPFKEAVAAFEKEYVRRLYARTGGDLRAMASRSGLSAERITTLMVTGDGTHLVNEE